MAETEVAPTTAPTLVAPNPFAALTRQRDALVETDSQRAIAEVQAAMVIAQRFPRDEKLAVDRILTAFTRETLAEQAMYTYNRGGTDITGPSIRAAETIAQHWGNLQFGIRELEAKNGVSTVEAFAWDVQTNVRQTKVFQVKHWRDTRSGGYKLEDQRDVYELVANQGARRLRACILGIIPGDVVESAMDQAEITLKTKQEATPERITKMMEKFADFGVTQAMIEANIQRRLDAITPGLMVRLGKILNSLIDGMSTPADWFKTEASDHGNPQTPPATALDQVKARARKTREPAKESSPPAAEARTDPAKGGESGAAPPTGSGPGVSYAEVAGQINRAMTGGDFDLLRDLIRSVGDEKQRGELTAMLDKRGADLVASRTR